MTGGNQNGRDHERYDNWWDFEDKAGGGASAHGGWDALSGMPVRTGRVLRGGGNGSRHGHWCADG